MVKVIESGHKYEIPCRYNDCSQQLQFVKIVNGELINGGLFGQDLLEVLIERLEFQLKNDVDDPMLFRKDILTKMQEALITYDNFTDWRKKHNLYHL